MDIRTWQDADRPDVPEPGFEDFSGQHGAPGFGYSYPDSHAGTAFTATDVISLGPADRAGERGGRSPYSARHRSNRSPFSPLRPAPIAIGSLSTAAIAAFAFVGPGILHGGTTGTPTPLLDGLPKRIAPLAASSSSAAATGPSSAATSTGSSAAPGALAGGGPTSSPTSVPNVVRGPKAPATPGTPSSPGQTSPRPSQPSQPGPGQPLNPPVSQPSQPPGTPVQPPTSVPIPPVTPPSIPPTTPPSTPPSSPIPPASPTVPTFNSFAAVGSALTEISTVRASQGAGPLRVDGALFTAASKHTSDMVRTHRFGHSGSDGSSPNSRAQSTGCWTLTKELIARGKPGDDVIGALLKDPDARQALLGFWNHSIGIAAQQDPTTGDVYWTIELAWT